MCKENDVAIILLGHGSRVKGAGKPMEEVARLVRMRYGFNVVETCYMSRLGPHYPEVFQTVVESGAKKVVVIPYFLHGGVHILLDIPEMMQKEAAKCPGVEVVLGNNLGFDELLADLVNKRILESRTLPDIRRIKLPSPERFPIPEGQCEFVPMKPEEAERYRREHGERLHE
jgi:sirohydrochlorin ferrochelatase